ncbi:hypothetical protein TNCV_4193171 [Trichonephila clavipes]|nr:hypothetical protein TNCV_4193171 [Trichonephila clavipes]
MYGRANGNDTATLRMYHTQFPDRRLPDHILFQQLHLQHRETPSFYVIRHDASRRRCVRSPCLKESILNDVPDRVKYKICCTSGKLSSPPELLPIGGTKTCAAATASSYHKQLL